ncbi:TonB-dependent receptor [Bacteroides congonensis]|uniref:TonB-dependent receptor n=1 Tax=Bacteroides congonensis TaxID=1871006 RepID=UPI00093264CD|nr:TonB-dependent receptor [Bacteroides congonensis]
MLQIYEFIVNQTAKGRSFILFFCLLLMQTSTFAQSSAKITIQKKNISIIEALKEVERQSDYSVGFNDSQLKNKPVLNLDLRIATIENALAQILKGSGFTYQFKGKYIMIIQDNKPKDIPVRKVTGKVVDESNEPLIGVNIKVAGSSEGAITDMDGNFTISVPQGGTLSFTYVGYTPQTVKITDKNAYEVILKSDTKQLSEVVVTALGIKREQKALSYNVQQVKSDELTQIKDANFVNSINGKVAGVTINSSSSGVGGASKVVMRGTKSIEQSSNALYVIDGIPMFNFGGGGSTEFGSKGATESIADINPEDIESISVLTGAAAAALYGSNAANGAIVVTTKKGKVGKLQASVSTGIDWMNPFVMPKFQNRYGTGSYGKANGSTTLSWGPKLNDASRKGYEPTDFFETGAVYSNSISLSAGSEKNQTFFSAAATNSDGMIPNNRYNRYNFTFRNTTSLLNDKMKLDVGASYIIQNDRNMINQGVYSNPLVSAYMFPRSDDFSLVKVFERWSDARKINLPYWPQGEGNLRMQNPYWIAYRNLHENNKKRYMLSAALTYDVLDWLSLSGRIRIDNSNNTYEQKLYAGTIATLTDGGTQGHYTIEKTETAQTYADFLANVNKRIDDFTLVVNLGTSLSRNTSYTLGYGGPIQDNGIPNLFNVYDLDNVKKRATQVAWEEMTQSIFANVEIGWKSMLYLTLTGRNDWASQIHGTTDPSFFYPSVGLSAVVTEMVKLPEWVDYLKVRGSYSSVGSPYPRYLTIPTFPYDATLQQWKEKSLYPIGTLYPERTNSWEVGVDATLLRDFKISASFYYANTHNQTFDPDISVSSGYDKLYVQTGSVRNVGVEGMLGYGHNWNGFRWDSSFTFSSNKNTLTELVRNYVHPETGEIINKDRLPLKPSDGRGLAQAEFILKEGGSLGDLYTRSDVVRDDKGRVQIDATGNVAKVGNLNDIKLGSIFPKANLAWNNSFSYKGINVGFLVSARIGGIVYSATQAAMDEYGVSERTAVARDAGGVLVNGRTMVDAQKWFEVIAGSSGLPQYYTYSATNVRLQEARIGYTIPRRWLGNVCDINVALVGRNLWMIYNKAPFDPESVATTGNFYQGIDYFMMPSSRNIGFNIKLNF